MESLDYRLLRPFLGMILPDANLRVLASIIESKLKDAEALLSKTNADAERVAQRFRESVRNFEKSVRNFEKSVKREEEIYLEKKRRAEHTRLREIEELNSLIKTTDFEYRTPLNRKLAWYKSKSARAKLQKQRDTLPDLMTTYIAQRDHLKGPGSNYYPPFTSTIQRPQAPKSDRLDTLSDMITSLKTTRASLRKIRGNHTQRERVSYFIQTRNSWFRKRLDLKQILLHSRYFHSTDPRDRIYAFLGVAESTFNIQINY